MAFFIRAVLTLFFIFPPVWAQAMTGWRTHESPALLLERPERGVAGREIVLPGELDIEDAVLSNGGYWYKVTVQDVTGWLFQDALFVRTGESGENERVTTVYDAMDEARGALFAGGGPGKAWVRRPGIPVSAGDGHAGGVIETWAAKDAVFQTMTLGDRTHTLYFAASTAQAARKFLGNAFVGLTGEELRSRLGGETSRAGSSLRYEQEGGHTFFDFRVEDGVVAEISYVFWPGNGMELPARTTQLRRFRGAPGEDWPRAAWVKGKDVRVRKEPSLMAEVVGRLHENGPPLVWLDTVDRGEAWPWYRVEFETAPGTYAGGWVYGQFLEPYRDGGTYADYFLDVTEHEFWTKTSSLREGLGKPVKSDGWIEDWPGLTLSYSSFHDDGTEEKYLSAVKISDARLDFGGTRVGDGVESLRELVDGLLADRWKGERELKEGENVFTHEEGLAEIVLVFKNGVLASMERVSRAAD